MKPTIQSKSSSSVTRSGSRPETEAATSKGGIPKVVYKSKGHSSSTIRKEPSNVVTKTATALETHPNHTNPTSASTADTNNHNPIITLQEDIAQMNIVDTTTFKFSLNHNLREKLVQKENNSCYTTSSSSVFEYLPRQLLKQKMIYESIQVLLDEKFLIHRCCELGLYKATKYHYRDWTRMIQTVTNPTLSSNGEVLKEEDTNEQSLFDALNQSPELAMVDDEESMMNMNLRQNKKITQETIGVGDDCGEQQPDMDTLMDSRFTSLELMKCLILSLLGKHVDGKQVQYLPQDVPKFTFLEAGQALWVLGISYFGIEKYDQALDCYHQSLYFLFLEQGYEEVLFLRGVEESDASLYVLLCSKVKPYSEAYRLLGIVMTRIGDVYSQKDSIEPALHSYKAAYEFCIRVIQYYFPQYEDSVKILDRFSRDDEPEIAAAILTFAGICKRIGAVYILQESYKDALDLYERTVELQTFILGNDHVDVGKTLHDMGVAERHAGHWDYALKCYAKAHKIFEDAYGSQHLDTGTYNW